MTCIVTFIPSCGLILDSDWLQGVTWLLTCVHRLLPVCPASVLLLHWCPTIMGFETFLSLISQCPDSPHGDCGSQVFYHRSHVIERIFTPTQQMWANIPNHAWKRMKNRFVLVSYSKRRGGEAKESAVSPFVKCLCPPSSFFLSHSVMLLHNSPTHKQDVMSGVSATETEGV